MPGAAVLMKKSKLSRHKIGSKPSPRIAKFELAQGVRHKAQGKGILSIFINTNP
jgi:hypothetical protein